MKRSDNLLYLRLIIDTVARYSSGEDPEIFVGKGSAQDIFLQTCLHNFFFQFLIALGATSNHTLFRKNFC